MKGSCPIKTSPQWTQSVEVLGEDNTWKLWMDSPEGDILPPIKGAFYMYIEDNPRKAADLLNKYIPLSKKADLTAGNKKSITEVISAANVDMFNDDVYQSWLAEQNFAEKVGEIMAKEAEEVTPPQTLIEVLEAVPNGSVFAKPINFLDLQNQVRTSQITYILANTATLEDSIPFEVISAAEAETILEGTEVSYNDQPVFILNDKAYYVTDNINMNTEVADMSIPFIAKLAVLKAKYFADTYQLLSTSSQGASLIEEVKSLNPLMTDLSSNRFKNLVMVQALKRYSDILKLNKERQSTPIGMDENFTRAISNLMAEIRLSLRTSFSNIEQRGIKADTSLNNLVRIYKDAGYNIVDEEVTNKDLVEYKDAIQKGVDEILAAVERDPSLKSLDAIIQNFILINSRQLNQTNDPIFFEIKQSLSDESGRFLRDISERLKYLRKENADTYDNLDNAFKAKALVSSLFTLEKTLDKINDFMSELQQKKGANEQEILDTLAKVAHYNYLLQGWDTFIKNTEQNLKNSQLSKDSSVYDLLARLNRAVGKGNDTYKAIQRKGAIKSTTQLLISFNKQIMKDYDDQIAALKAQPDNAYRRESIRNLEKKKEKYNFTEEKIEKMYRGELGDANFWSSMFESYTTNPDPIIASFALFLKGHTQDILNTAITKSTKYVDQARPLMQRLGMDNINFKKDWQEFLMIDKKPIRGEDGKVTFQTVLTFQAPVKDYRFELALLDEKIKEAELSDDKLAYKNAVKAKEQHLNKYFNRKYKRDYYLDQAKLQEEDFEAYKALEAVNLKIEAFKNANPSDVDFFMKYDEFTVLNDERKELYNIYNVDGTLKDKQGQNIAEALQKHGARMRKYYKSKEKAGAFQRAFESGIELLTKEFKGTAYDSFGEPTPEFEEAVINKWLEQNTIKRYSEAFYTKQNKLYDELNALSAELPEEYRTADLFKAKTNLLRRFKDENGQTDPSLMGINKETLMAELKAIQEKIDEILEKRDSEYLVDHPELQMRFDETIAKFGELTYKEPSDYYLDEINQKLIALGVPALNKKTASDFISKKVDILKIEQLKEKNKGFKDWFDKNHIKKEKVNEKGKKTYKYQRLDAWNVAQLKEAAIGTPSFIVETVAMLGTKEYVIKGVPANKYFYRSVKDEFRTIEKGKTPEESAAIREKAVGTIIDNRNQYLPLSEEQFREQGRIEEYNDPKNDLKKYRNNDYYTLIQNKDKKDLLELTKKYHLSNQHEIDRDQKLYLDLPRYPITTMLEGTQSGQIYRRWVDRIQAISRGIAATFSGKSREDANEASEQDTDVVDEFANPDTEKSYEITTMLQEGLLNPVLDRIGIRGIQNLDIEKVSYDVIAALNVYMLQTEKQKVYNKISPLANAIANTLEDTDANIDQLNALKEKAFSIGDGAKHLLLEDGKSVRATAFRAFTKRELKGQQNSSKYLDWLNKITAGITGGASMNYFALNLPSAIKNYWGILWQMNIEAIAGEYFDFKSMGKGKVASKIAMNEWSTRIWGGKMNTLYTQMIMRFDPTQGKAEEALVTNFSRTFAKDLASVSWVYSPRKFMEMEGGLQLFFSMMHHVKVPQINNGVESFIDYADAWEMDSEGRMTLKKGVDPAYGITYNEDGSTELGAEFKKFQNRVHEKFKDLNGTFAKFEQPQAGLYFAFRLFAFMRRYFTSMFMNRFGKERANHALETVRTGYYIEAIQSVGKMIVSFGQHAASLAPSERRALMKTTIDLVQIFAIGAVASLLFGYDDDDEERFAKLRAKSGALGEDDFRIQGWLSNHILTLLIKTQQENQSFIPLPKFGLNNYIDFTSSTSIAFGPTIHGGAKIMNQLATLAMPGDSEDAYYKKDVGPYPWQKEGQLKIWNTVSGMFGFSGSQTSPVKGLESSEAYSKK